jgi:hypothetical protein
LSCWVSFNVSKKALYRHKQSGDLFAIETYGTGKVISTSGNEAKTRLVESL